MVHRKRSRPVPLGLEPNWLFTEQSLSGDFHGLALCKSRWELSFNLLGLQHSQFQPWRSSAQHLSLWLSWPLPARLGLPGFFRFQLPCTRVWLVFRTGKATTGELLGKNIYSILTFRTEESTPTVWYCVWHRCSHHEISFRELLHYMLIVVTVETVGGLGY